MELEVLGTLDARTPSSCRGKTWVAPARQSTPLDNLAPNFPLAPKSSAAGLLFISCQCIWQSSEEADGRGRQ